MDDPLTSSIAAARDPEMWRVVASRLKRGADLLWSECTALHEDEARARHDRIEAQRGDTAMGQEFEDVIAVCSSAMMLYGFALENLVKGVLVGRDPNRVSEKEPLFAGWNHNLRSYAAEVLDLSDDETDLLIRLTTYITWSGRYPVGSRPTRHGLFYPSGNLFKSRVGFGSNDRPLIDSLYQRLSELLSRENWPREEERAEQLSRIRAAHNSEGRQLWTFFTNPGSQFSHTVENGVTYLDSPPGFRTGLDVRYEQVPDSTDAEQLPSVQGMTNCVRCGTAITLAPMTGRHAAICVCGYLHVGVRALRDLRWFTHIQSYEPELRP